ncbi:MAG TPA: hypothetical protein VFZ25_02820, partial [Chloroflexota bacterium]|nr:hypothetical protein [Chloroflexota bacterium]
MLRKTGRISAPSRTILGTPLARKLLSALCLACVVGLLGASFPAPARASGSPTPTPTPTSVPTATVRPVDTPSSVQAGPLLDWAIPNGHFYTQANGYPLGRSPMGYAIVDDAQARFWTGFQHLGGVPRLGYP